MLMEGVRVYKTSEKLMLWMKRKNLTQEQVAFELGITRQTLASRLKDNYFSVGELIALKRIGFEG
jgi:transcriptional regulator with XRE-family HTH domain